MYVFIARHGESLATVDPEWMGRMVPSQIPLTVWGYEQAIEIGQQLADLYSHNEHFRSRRIRIYSSLQHRLKQTSDAIIKALPISLVTGNYINPLLRQREHGAFDGLSREDKRKTDPVVYAELHSSDPLVRYITEMPGGESLQQLEERLRHFVERLKRDLAEDEDVLIVNHGPQCRILEAILTHSDPIAASQSNRFGTGDVVKVETGFVNPGFAQIFHTGIQRSKDIGNGLKIEAMNYM